MSQNELKVRVQHKHDIEANWDKASNFIPRDGEIVIYKADENNSSARIKIGDGETNINKLPFFKGEYNGSGGTYIIPDWSASENEEGYIKNRTHYEEKTILLPSSYVEVTEEGNGSYYGELSSVVLEEGQTYFVVFNNKNYECIAKKIAGQGIILLGNGTLCGYEEVGNNEPFGCDYYPGDDTFYLNVKEQGTYQLEIFNNYSLITLDDRFISENIARKNDIPTEIASLIDDEAHRTVTDEEKNSWNNKSNFSGNYNDLINKPEIPSINGLATEDFVTDQVGAIKIPVLSVNGNEGIVNLKASDVGAATPEYVDEAIENLNVGVISVNEKTGSSIVLKAEDVGATTKEYVDEQLKNISTGVTSINNLTGDVTLTAKDIHALPDNEQIPSSLLPSYMDDVVEYDSFGVFPGSGLPEKIYLDRSTNLVYRWSGSTYVEVSPSIALGETSATAYRGDYGAKAYKHAVTNKGEEYDSGFYKIATNAEGHVIDAIAVKKADITNLGIPSEDTGMTSVEIKGSGNAITTATYDTENRALILTKGATYTSNEGTITGVTAGASLLGSGTSGNVTISHNTGSAINKTMKLYKFSTDETSHVSSVTEVTKEDILTLGIPTYEALSNAEIEAICTIA